MHFDARDINPGHEGNGDGPAWAMAHTCPGLEWMSADFVTGDVVLNRQGEDLGDVMEIMLDMRTGRMLDMHTGKVSYAVLSFGGFLDMGEKLLAMPWQALTLDAVGKRLIVDKSRLETASGSPHDDRPDMADTIWELGIHRYQRTKPSVDLARA